MRSLCMHHIYCLADGRNAYNMTSLRKLKKKNLSWRLNQIIVRYIENKPARPQQHSLTKFLLLIYCYTIAPGAFKDESVHARCITKKTLYAVLYSIKSGQFEKKNNAFFLHSGNCFRQHKMHWRNSEKSGASYF